MKKIIISIILSAITFSIPNCLLAEENKNIIGIWEKYYFEQNDQKNYDSRWELKVSFSNTGEFIWGSTFLQEKWLVNTKTGERSTQVIPHKSKLEGKYLIQNKKCFIVFDRPLIGEDKEAAINNLGYNERTKKCSVEIYFEKELLAIKELRFGRTIFFKKIKNDF